MSLPDTLHDAQHSVRQYLKDDGEVYDWIRPRIDALVTEMRRVYQIIDIYQCPFESLRPQAVPIRLLVDREPMTAQDHDEANKLVDALYAHLNKD